MLNREICERCQEKDPAVTPPERKSWVCYLLARESLEISFWVTEESVPPEHCPKAFEQAIAAGMRKKNAS